MMEEKDENDFDLRHAWRTFAVPTDTYLAGLVNSRRDGEYTLLRPYRVVGTSADDESLFFLSLITPNRDLLSTTTQLFVQFNSQFRECVADCEKRMALLRASHEQQLTDLVEAANRDTRDMVVSSDLTQKIVLKHQCELEKLQQECRENEMHVEVEVQKSLFAFLKKTAPDALTALAKENKRKSLHASMEQNTRITNISHFVSSTDVPVRTVELPNLLRHEVVGARMKDVSLRPIVVDVSPISLLQNCLTSLYSEEQDTAAAAVTEHLLRLSQHAHAVLLLIGSEAEAELLLSTPSAELFLKHSFFSSGPPQFVPLKRHSHLKLMLSTRFWGANIILLWTPPKGKDPPSVWPPVVEDALNLAFSWNADMFSVAVMESSIYWQTASTMSSIEQAQSVSITVLRQLQRSVGRLAYEAADVKVPTLWGMQRAAAAEMHNLTQLERWRDDYAIALPTSAVDPHVVFNTNIAVRAFFPLSVFHSEEESGGEDVFARKGRSSIAADSSSSFSASPVLPGVHDKEEEVNRRRRRRQRHGMSITTFLNSEGFSGELTASPESNLRLQRPMTFKKLLSYTFGETVVVH